VLRRLIHCGTPTAAKKYGQTLRIHFFGRLLLLIEGFLKRLHREKQYEDGTEHN
jgi:hypothetical protein